MRRGTSTSEKSERAISPSLPPSLCRSPLFLPLILSLRIDVEAKNNAEKRRCVIRGALDAGKTAGLKTSQRGRRGRPDRGRGKR